MSAAYADRVMSDAAMSLLAGSDPKMYWQLRRAELIFGGVIFVSFLGLIGLAIYAGAKESENTALKNENKQLKARIPQIY